MSNRLADTLYQLASGKFLSDQERETLRREIIALDHQTEVNRRELNDKYWGSLKSVFGLNADGDLVVDGDLTVKGGNISVLDGSTEMVHIGNMYNLFGTGFYDRYGIGIGDYAAGNYLSYNAETADTFIIKAGGGSVAIDATGVQIDNGLTSRLMFTSSTGEKGSGKGVNFIAYVKDFIIHNYEVGGYVRSAINMTDDSVSYTRLWEISTNAMRFDISVATAGSSFAIGGGMVLDSAGEITAIGDTRIGGGLYVGSVSVNPDADDVWCDGEISTDGGTTKWDLGAYTADTDVVAIGYVTVTIEGTPYKLMVRA